MRRDDDGEVDWRPLSPDDLDDLHELVAVCEEADGGPYRTSLLEAGELLDGNDLGQDSWVGRIDRAPVAWGLLEHGLPAEPGSEQRIVVLGAVHPGYRGLGVGRRLLAWQIERARSLAASHDGQVDARIHPESAEDGRGELAARQGFRIVRWSEELGRDLAPLRAEPPDGITVRPWRPADDDAALVVRNAAWRDHWGGADVTPAQWRRRLDASSTRQDLSHVAADRDGGLVGMLLTDHYPQDEPFTGLVGWISILAVEAAHRGRGIASALIAASLGSFAEAGFDGAIIGVDATSPTGAGRLYRHLGFELIRRNATWSLPLD